MRKLYSGWREGGRWVGLMRSGWAVEALVSLLVSGLKRSMLFEGSADREDRSRRA